jgi:hypothetical protein
MKKVIRSLCVVISAMFLLSGTGTFQDRSDAESLTGSWLYDDGIEQRLLVFIDGYNTYTVYNVSAKKFIETSGGPFTVGKDAITITTEFDTKDARRIGTMQTKRFASGNNQLTFEEGGRKITFLKKDDGQTALSGLWQITGRMQNGKVAPIHRTGTRKTIKILSGTRFQWAAIDPGSKQFYGTGGGTYEFANGRYTEHIEFFSRDSSRVGSSLSFDGKLENGDWHHSGLSSKGDKIYEVWSRSTR